MENNEKEQKMQELIKKYGLDIEKLKQEQIKLAKELKIKDKIDFSLADRFGAFDNTFIGNKMLACVVVCDKDMEVVDMAYSFEKVRFPYLPGFRNYRELVPMINAFDKLKEKPDIVIIPGQGISHQRLGLASNFGLSSNIPTIGVSNSIVDCEVKGDDILKNGKKVGKVLLSKEGSNPLYISPGDHIGIESSYELCKGMIKLPHKRPEPMHLAAKYAKEVRKEVGTD